MAGKHLCTGLILQCLILCKCSALATPKDNITGELLLRHVGRALAQCLSQADKWQCFELQLAQTVDAAARNNNTWQYNDFLIIEKSVAADNAPPQQGFDAATTPRQQRFLPANASSLGAKLLQLAKSRTIRLQLPQTARPLQRVGSRISDAIDSLSGIAAAAPGIDGGLLESVDEGSKSKKKIAKKKKDKIIPDFFLNNKNPLKGRKKKDKDKHMAMMGGMAMVAMVAQMFFGKVLLIAGAAFVMAKIALLVSVLGSLKKGLGGSSGSTTEHVIVTGGGGGHGGHGGHGHDSHDSGWHRSMPYDSPKLEVINEAPPHHGDSGPPAQLHAHPHPPAPPPSGGHEHSSYYNYEIPEVDEGGDGGGGGDYKRRHAAGFLRR